MKEKETHLYEMKTMLERRLGDLTIAKRLLISTQKNEKDFDKLMYGIEERLDEVNTMIIMVQEQQNFYQAGEK